MEDNEKRLYRITGRDHIDRKKMWRLIERDCEGNLKILWRE
jgi:hypothetical protein